MNCNNNIREIVSYGGQEKINLTIEPIDGFTLVHFDWVAEFRGHRGKVTIRKADATRVDDENYICVVDTTKTGTGDLICTLTAYVPDAQVEGGIRRMVDQFDTGITVVKIWDAC